MRLVLGAMTFLDFRREAVDIPSLYQCYLNDKKPGNRLLGSASLETLCRYYIRLRKKLSNESKQRMSTIGWDSAARSHLNSRPIDEILEAAREELRRQQENLAMEVDTAMSDSVSSSAHTQLWVEKYAPRSFVDLISDDVSDCCLKLLLATSVLNLKMMNYIERIFLLH